MITSLLSTALLLLSSMVDDPNSADLPPAGSYRFSAKTEAGKLIYTGTISIAKWHRQGEQWTADGRRTIKAHLSEKDLNPIAGNGAVHATFANGRVGFDLHPRFRDFNTTLDGQWKNGKIKGEWGSSTFVGYKKKGTFEMTPAKLSK